MNLPDEHETHDEDEAPARDGSFPIRVVSQRTGVNSVTLRAWERRYGLLRPMRTPKGHRLYGEADVERVLRILDWIDRGVSIGRVRALLERDEATAAGAVPIDVRRGPEVGEGDWSRYALRMYRAVALFDENGLDQAANEALSLYPFVTVCERLLNPLEGVLQERSRSAPGDLAGRVFFEGWLRRKLAARLQFDDRRGGSAPVLIASLPGSANLVALRSLAIGCVEMEIPVLLLEAVLPAEELVVVAGHRQPAAILLHGDAAQEDAVFSHLLSRLVEARLAPVVVAGKTANIHEALICASGAQALVDTPLPLAVRRLSLPLRDAARGGRDGGAP